MLHDVFISYATPDLAKATSVVDLLRLNKYSSWFAPTSINGGDAWLSEIASNIPISRVVLALLSESSSKSTYVINELIAAQQNRKVIIPVTLDQFAPGAKVSVLLGGTQHIPFDPISIVTAVDHVLGTRRTVPVQVPNSMTAQVEPDESNPWAILRTYSVPGANKPLHFVLDCPALRGSRNVSSTDTEDFGDVLDLCFEQSRFPCVKCVRTLRTKRDGAGTLLFHTLETEVHTHSIVQHRDGVWGIGFMHVDVPFSAVTLLEPVNFGRTGIKTTHNLGKPFEIIFTDEKRRDLALDILATLAFPA